MNPRTVGIAVGAGVATFLVVAVALIEALPFEFSAIVGLPVGLLAGALVFVAIVVTGDSLGPVARRSVAGVAGFGYAVVLLLAVRYVNLVGLRSAITVESLVAVAVAVGVAVFVASWVAGRESAPA